MKVWSTLGAVGLALCAGQAFGADGGAAHKVKQATPVKMGTSGGSLNDASSAFCCGGTLGALVLRDGVLCILSNNHVLARSGSAAAGEDTVQPALIDSACRGTTSNIVGDFIGNLVPLGSANVDTGLSVARSGMVDTTGAILDIGVPCSTLQAPALNMQVMKSGRTTGFTAGSITSLNTSVTITYQKGCNSGKKFNISFTNQVVTTAMSAGGDSGSVLYSNDGTANPVGLLFAGSSSVTIYNPIQSVVNAYTAGGHTFSFVGNSCPAAAEIPPLGPAQADLDKALLVKVEHEHDLMNTPGVWGVGVGSAVNNATEAVIVVYMEQPGRGAVSKIPQEIDGVKVRVIYTDPFVAQ